MQKKRVKKDMQELHKVFVEIPAEKFAEELLSKQRFQSREFLSAFKKGRDSYMEHRQMVAASSE